MTFLFFMKHLERQIKWGSGYKTRGGVKESSLIALNMNIDYKFNDKTNSFGSNKNLYKIETVSYMR